MMTPINRKEINDDRNGVSRLISIEQQVQQGKEMFHCRLLFYL